MRDLTVAMGISSPSLYAIFGDKQRLYLEAISETDERLAQRFDQEIFTPACA